MNTNLKALASLVLVSALAGAHAEAPAAAPDPAPKTSRKHHAKVVHPTGPTVQSQIEALRSDLTAQKTQIDTLQQQLSASQQQLTQAQASAQAAMQQAQDAMSTQQAAIQQNTQSVNTLQSAVTDLTANNASLASTLQTDQATTKKMILHPDALGYKGITISPAGSFVAFETVDRSRATGSDIPTPFSAIPLSASDAGHLSEFYATGRQSRLTLNAVGKLNNATLRGFYEMDFLGTGVTSNNNQSNSYVLRERQIWGQAAFTNGFSVTGGQMWSLVTETKTGLENATEYLPQTIDPNYNVGYVWARQPSIRFVYKASPMLSAGVSLEQAQTLAPGCSASSGGYCPINYLAGAVGASGGLYNSAGAPGTVSVGGSTGITTTPTDAFNAPVTTYAYNLSPDMMAKLGLDSKLAHVELFGIARVFRNRIYPNENGQTGQALSTTVAAGSGAYNNSSVGGGVGGSVRLHTFMNKVDFGIKGMYGDGTSRYGTTQLADVTLQPNAQFALLHNFSALGTIEANVTPRLAMNFYYGTDYVFRSVFTDGTGTGTEGYGSPLLATSGCGTEPAPGTTVGGASSTGSVNGFSPTSAGSCAPQTKDTQEGTVSMYYDFYKGPMGRIREGFQYSYIERFTYPGQNSIAPKATENVVETSFRYYLP
jgi:hypothetical protein